ITVNGMRKRPGGGGLTPTMTPEHVAAWPGTSALKGVSRVRSSWRRGTKKSASSTVRSPFFSSWRARCGPTPLTNCRAIGRPAGESVCFKGAGVLENPVGPVHENRSPGSVHGAALRYLREGPLCRSHDQPRTQADEAALASQPRLDAGGG